MLYRQLNVQLLNVVPAIKRTVIQYQQLNVQLFNVVPAIKRTFIECCTGTYTMIEQGITCVPNFIWKWRFQ